MVINSLVFAKMIFWIENMFFYIPQMLLTELMYVPLIYFRVIFKIVTLAGHEGPKLLAGWCFGGLFFLMYGVCSDMFNYIKLLCDLQLDNEKAD
jgi:hypothetical protein